MEILEAYDLTGRCVVRRRWRGVITRRSRDWSLRGRWTVCRRGRGGGRWSTGMRRRSLPASRAIVRCHSSRPGSGHRDVAIAIAQL